MPLCSLSFALLILIGLVLYHLARTTSQRRFVLLLLSTVFVTAQVDELLALAPLLMFIGSLLFSIHLINRVKSRRLFIACIVLILTLFVYLKRYSFVAFLPELPCEYTSLGLSYILFRGLHVLIDTYQEEAPRTDLELIPLLIYLTSFLTFIAGPIQRYDEFREQEAEWNANPRVSPEAVGQALFRISSGCLKVLMLSPLLQRMHDGSFERISRHPEWLAAAAVANILNFYVNFGGYMDIVVGVGALFGQSLPENFNSPLVARNFLELWSRWHITLSEWFKTYVFNPMMQFFCARCSRPEWVPYFGVAAYFVVFFLLGVWHGASPRFLVLGLLLGVGVSVNKLYEVEMIRRLGKARFLRFREYPGYQTSARALMLTFFSFTGVLAWQRVTGLDWLGSALGALGAIGLVRAIVACFLGFAVAELAIRFAIAIGRQVARVWPYAGPPTAWRCLAASVQVCLVGLFLHGMWKQAALLNAETKNGAAPAPITSTQILYEKY